MSKTCLAFVVGAGIGSLVTYLFMKQKYDAIYDFAEEDFPEVKESEKKNESDDKEKSSDDKVVFDYAHILKENEYVPKENDEPYLIRREEYGSRHDYEVSSLTYYASDDVLVDENDEVIEKEEIGSLVGDNFSDYFGTCDDDPDAVYIRNERLKTDFEILRDLNAYYTEEELS